MQEKQQALGELDGKVQRTLTIPPVNIRLGLQKYKVKHKIKTYTQYDKIN